MSDYFVKYVLTDHKIRAFFGKISDEKGEEEARKIIMDRLKKAYGKSLLDAEITKQDASRETLMEMGKQKTLDEVGF